MTPAALVHGPVPMRSRASSVDVLRYARHVFAPSSLDTAPASDAQNASAPPVPPRFPPLPAPRLVTKKLIDGPPDDPAASGVEPELPSQAVAPPAVIEIEKQRAQCWSVTDPSPGPADADPAERIVEAELGPAPSSIVGESSCRCA